MNAYTYYFPGKRAVFLWWGIKFKNNYILERIINFWNKKIPVNQKAFPFHCPFNKLSNFYFILLFSVSLPLWFPFSVILSTFFVNGWFRSNLILIIPFSRISWGFSLDECKKLVEKSFCRFVGFFFLLYVQAYLSPLRFDIWMWNASFCKGISC